VLQSNPLPRVSPGSIHVLHPTTMMSSSNKKKVHYTSSTKGKSSHSYSKSHSHKGSRDSGVGSSSASDRASVGDTNDSPFNSQEIQYQRHNPTALAEALDAANDKIRDLLENNEQLQRLLKESNKEKRSLREEKIDLIAEVEDLGRELDEEKRAHNKLRREVSPRAVANSSSTRRTTPSSSHRRRDDERSQGSGSYREESGRRYIVPQPPPNNAPNPFTPLSERTSAPSGVTYAPAATVTSSPDAYSTAPTFAARPAGSGASGSSYGASNDGNYHSYPV
jgi:hypothetical protein